MLILRQVWPMVVYNLAKQASRADFLIAGSSGMELPFPSRRLFQSRCADCGRLKSRRAPEACECDAAPAQPQFSHAVGGTDSEDALSTGLLTPLARECVCGLCV